MTVVALYSICFFNGEILARLFNDQSDINRAVFKNKGVDVIEFRIILEKGTVSLADSQLFKVRFDPKKYIVDDPESFYKAMTAWEELPFKLGNFDKDLVVHSLKMGNEFKPMVIYDEELRRLLVKYGCRSIGRFTPSTWYTLPTDYHELYIVVPFDSCSIEGFVEKCRDLKSVKNIELIYRPAVDSSPQSGSAGSVPNHESKIGQANSFQHSDVSDVRFRRKEAESKPRRDDPPAGFTYEITGTNMSILIESAMHSDDPGLLVDGDWIGAFDEAGHCYGAEEVNWSDGGVGLAVWGDDVDEGVNGFEGNELIYLKIYDSSTQLTYDHVNVYVESVIDQPPERNYSPKYLSSSVLVVRIGTWPDPDSDFDFESQWYLLPWYLLDGTGRNCNIMPGWYHIAQRTDLSTEMNNLGAGITIGIMELGGVYLPDPDNHTSADPGLALVGGFYSEGYRALPALFKYVNHGNAVTGVIACGMGQSERGVVGIAPGCDIYGFYLQHGDSVIEEDGLDVTNRSIIALASDAPVNRFERPIRLYNCSWRAISYYSSFGEAVQTAISQGKIIVAISGNYGEEPYPNRYFSYPAGYQGVFAIGALNQSYQVADFSNWYDLIGPPQEYQKQSIVDFVAPGENIRVVPGGNSIEFNQNGTSFAAPQVTAMIAILLRIDPNLSRDDLYSVFKRHIVHPFPSADNGNDGHENEWGWGMIDFFEVLKDDILSYGQLSTDELGDQNPIIAQTDISVYPNPSNGRVGVMLDISISGEVTVEVYDVLGRFVTSNTVGQQGPKRVAVFDSSDWASGRYVAVVFSRDRFIGSQQFVLIK